MLGGVLNSFLVLIRIFCRMYNFHLGNHNKTRNRSFYTEPTKTYRLTKNNRCVAVKKKNYVVAI